MQTRKKNVFKKAIYFLLTLALLLPTLVPFTVAANTVDPFLFPGGPVFGYPIIIPAEPEDGTNQRNIILIPVGDAFVEPDKNPAGGHIRGTGSEDLTLWTLSNTPDADYSNGASFDLSLEEVVWTEGRAHLRIEGTGEGGTVFYIIPDGSLMVSGETPEPQIVYIIGDAPPPPPPPALAGKLGLRVRAPGIDPAISASRPATESFPRTILPFGVIPNDQLQILVTAPAGFTFARTTATDGAQDLDFWRVAQWFGDLEAYDDVLEEWYDLEYANDAILTPSLGSKAIGLMLDSAVMVNANGVPLPAPTASANRESAYMLLTFTGDNVSGGDWRSNPDDRSQMLVRALDGAWKAPGAAFGVYNKIPIDVPEIPISITLLSSPGTPGSGGNTWTPNTAFWRRPLPSSEATLYNGLMKYDTLTADVTPQLHAGSYRSITTVDRDRVYTFQIDLAPVSGALFTQAANDPALWRISARDGYHPNTEARGMEILNVNATPNTRRAFITITGDELDARDMTGDGPDGNMPFNLYFRSSMLTPVVGIDFADVQDGSEGIEFTAVPIAGTNDQGRWEFTWLEGVDKTLSVDFYWTAEQVADAYNLDISSGGLDIDTDAIIFGDLVNAITEDPFFDLTSAGFNAANPISHVFVAIDGEWDVDFDTLYFVWNGHEVYEYQFADIATAFITSYVDTDLTIGVIALDLATGTVDDAHSWAHLRSGSTLEIFVVEGTAGDENDDLIGSGELDIPRAYTGDDEPDAVRLSAVTVPSTLAADRRVGWYSDAGIVNVYTKPPADVTPPTIPGMHVGLWAVPYNPGNNNRPTAGNAISNTISFEAFRETPFTFGSGEGSNWTGYNSLDEGVMKENRHFFDVVIVGRGLFGPVAAGVVEDPASWRLAYGNRSAVFEKEPANVPVTWAEASGNPANQIADPALELVQVIRVDDFRLRFVVDQISGEEPIAFSDIMANGLWVVAQNNDIYAQFTATGVTTAGVTSPTAWDNAMWAGLSLSAANIGDRIDPKPLQNFNPLSYLLFPRAARWEVAPITPPSVAGIANSDEPVIEHEDMGGGIHLVTFALDDFEFALGQETFRNTDVTNLDNWETTVWVVCDHDVPGTGTIPAQTVMEGGTIRFNAPIMPAATTYAWAIGGGLINGTNVEIVGATNERTFELGDVQAGGTVTLTINGGTPRTFNLTLKDPTGDDNWQCQDCYPSPFGADNNTNITLINGTDNWWTPAEEEKAGLRLIGVNYVDTEHVTLEFTGAADSLDNDNLRFFIRATSDDTVNIDNGARERALTIAHRQTTVEPQIAGEHGGWINIVKEPDDIVVVISDEFMYVSNLFADEMTNGGSNPFDPIWPLLIDEDSGEALGKEILVLRDGAPARTAPRQREIEVTLSGGLEFKDDAFTQNLGARALATRGAATQVRPLHWSIYDTYQVEPFYATETRGGNANSYYYNGAWADDAAWNLDGDFQRGDGGFAGNSTGDASSLFAYGMELIFVAPVEDDPSKAILRLVGDAERHENAVMMIWVNAEALEDPSTETEAAGGVYAIVRVGDDLRPELITPDYYLDPTDDDEEVTIRVFINNDAFTREAADPAEWEAAIVSNDDLTVEIDDGGVFEGETNIRMPFAPGRMGEVPDLSDAVTIKEIELPEQVEHYIDGSNHFTYVDITLEGTFPEDSALVLRPVTSDPGTAITADDYQVLALAGGTLIQDASDIAVVNDFAEDSLRLPVTYLVIPIGEPEPEDIPAVLSVSVTPKAPVGRMPIAQGGTQQFYATVTTENGASAAVNWSVTPATSGTIDQDGFLTVNGDAPAGNLTVTATSLFDDTKSDESRLTVVVGALNILNVTIGIAEEILAPFIDGEEGYLIVEVGEDTTDIEEGTLWVFRGTVKTLQDAIEEAKDAIEEGSPDAVLMNQASNLNAAIDNFIENIHGVSEATPYEIALLALKQSILTAEQLIADAEVSEEDEEDVDEGIEYWNQADIDDLQEAIDEAQAVYDNELASEEDLDEARLALNEAIDAFEAAKKIGTKEDDDDDDTPLEILEALILDAEELIDNAEVSEEDEEDVELGTEYWNQADIDDLLDAIEAAQAVFDDPDATDEELEEAIEALEEAIAAFEAAKKIGTKEDDEDGCPICGEDFEGIRCGMNGWDPDDFPCITLWQIHLDWLESWGYDDLDDEDDKDAKDFIESICPVHNNEVHLWWTNVEKQYDYWYWVFLTHPQMIQDPAPTRDDVIGWLWGCIEGINKWPELWQDYPDFPFFDEWLLDDTWTPPVVPTALIPDDYEPEAIVEEEDAIENDADDEAAEAEAIEENETEAEEAEAIEEETE